MKIAINVRHGGFSLSEKAMEALAARGNTEASEDLRNDNLRKWGMSDAWRIHDTPRNDPDLISVIETLGAESFGRYATLLIVDIPDGVDWEIKEYDGWEHVAEKHRTWP